MLFIFSVSIGYPFHQRVYYFYEQTIIGKSDLFSWLGIPCSLKS